MAAKKYKTLHNRFQRHASILMWKSYLQRQRRWRLLISESVLATIIFVVAIFIAKPVFLTPLEAEPQPPLTSSDMLASLNKDNIVGYAPDDEIYQGIMARAAELLQIDIASAETEYDLNNLLYEMAKNSTTLIEKSVIWIIWNPKDKNMWKFSIRSTERARYETGATNETYPNPHLRAGFLAVQLAISKAIVELESATTPNYELNLVSMPVSPLMQESDVRRALAGILLCFTLALIPPVLETQALVVFETVNKFKRGLRIRGVGYSSMYAGWLAYAYLTALPIAFLAAVTLILIFRWIHLVVAFVIVLAYVTVQIMTALIMAMFHNKAFIACIWSTMFTLMQTYLAELLVHHEYGAENGPLTLLLHIVLPPLGLVNTLNQFALLETGRGGVTKSSGYSIFYSLGSWTLLMIVYFSLLMLLQRTIGHERAIGGQVSWKAIIFKKVEDMNKLRPIETPTGKEREKLQAVDEMVAKAISFRNVSKSVMGIPILSNITMDIYRGEFTMLFTERIQERIMATIDDLLTGLTFADKGSIYVLGHRLKPSHYYITEPHMMGYCHRADVLIPELTVEEHLIMFIEICLWNESNEYISEYGHIRCKRLLSECDLSQVQRSRVRCLDAYYRAQLCWAIAMLLEPRVILLSNFSGQHPHYVTVLKDKIMTHKKYLTLVKMCFTSIKLEYADRVFVFDTRVLAFGGTPAYMFFKYGREYRVRLTIRNDSTDDLRTLALLERAVSAGAVVRAHLGTLLILRLPANPTEKVAELVRDLISNTASYGVTSVNVSVPDLEEVYRRAIHESRSAVHETTTYHELCNDALRRYSEPQTWKRRQTWLLDFTQLRKIGWKYFSFHLHYRLYFIFTMVSVVSAGVFIGLSLSTMLARSDRDDAVKKLLHGEKLTMEFVTQETTLVLRSDNSTIAKSMAHAYVLSEPGATEDDIKHISYTALSHTESVTEYLVTRAIDSPQLYVHIYAYGMDVRMRNGTDVLVNVLYSPRHRDYGAAARSLAKVYSTLLRHYSGKFDASIQVTDDPLALDLTPWMKFAKKPPLLIQFLLILSISHITLIPSMEYGLIRHMQSNALNFSPLRYWFTLYCCDLLLYWALVAVMTAVMVLIVYLVAPAAHFQYSDLLVVPFMLILYGVACVPQAYLFSLGPRVALNSMTFIIVNIVFAETTILAKIFYGEVLDIVLYLMSLSPQFNMAYAYVKIKQIFLYNSECIIFRTQNLCSNKILHKCCTKCGVLQKCFVRKRYLNNKEGILREAIALCVVAVIYTTILLLVEYRLVPSFWNMIVSRFTKMKTSDGRLKPGTARMKKDVLNKVQDIKNKRNVKVDTFGEFLLANNLTRQQGSVYSVHDVYLGLGKGEALALSGLKRHGRLQLVEILAGYKVQNEGDIWCMSKWKLGTNFHKYTRQISLCCERTPLPPWMTVYDGLELLGLLRGVPPRQLRDELKNLLDALDFQSQSTKLLRRIALRTELTRLSFAAAVIGAPPLIVLDECTAYQKYSVRRAMYSILHTLRRRGHGVFISSSNIESHMPITNQLAILLDGTIYDVDSIDNLVGRYSNKGYTVVVHLKDDVDVNVMFGKHFDSFTINDSTDVLVNVQILDSDLNWSTIFQKMEDLKRNNPQVYSYIITVIPIDYIYNSIINNEKGNKMVMDFWYKRSEPKIKPSQEVLNALIPFEQKYDIVRLKELPWSVIFHT